MSQPHLTRREAFALAGAALAAGTATAAPAAPPIIDTHFHLAEPRQPGAFEAPVQQVFPKEEHVAVFRTNAEDLFGL